MSDTEDSGQTELIEWLQERGHTAAQIKRILTKVEEYDKQTILDSLFDSIETGGLNIESIIQEALDEEE